MLTKEIQEKDQEYRTHMQKQIHEFERRLSKKGESPGYGQPEYTGGDHTAFVMEPYNPESGEEHLESNYRPTYFLPRDYHFLQEEEARDIAKPRMRPREEERKRPDARREKEKSTYLLPEYLEPHENEI